MEDWEKRRNHGRTNKAWQDKKARRVEGEAPGKEVAYYTITISHLSNAFNWRYMAMSFWQNLFGNCQKSIGIDLGSKDFKINGNFGFTTIHRAGVASLVCLALANDSCRRPPRAPGKR